LHGLEFLGGRIQNCLGIRNIVRVHASEFGGLIAGFGTNSFRKYFRNLSASKSLTGFIVSFLVGF
jgi:hypothetical protein